MKSVLLIAVGLLMSFSALADGPIMLKAQSGEEIKIWYGPYSYTDGNTASKYVGGVHIAVTSGIPGITRVVLVNNCYPSNQWIAKQYTISYNCGYSQDGTWVNSENCAISGPTEYGDDNTITTWWANHGGQTNCYQQVAVSKARGEWLVDPVTGEHNFNFRFPQKN